MSGPPIEVLWPGDDGEAARHRRRFDARMEQVTAEARARQTVIDRDSAVYHACWIGPLVIGCAIGLITEPWALDTPISVWTALAVAVAACAVQYRRMRRHEREMFDEEDSPC